MRNELRAMMDEIMEKAHTSIPCSYRATATQHVHGELDGEGFLVAMKEYPHDVLAFVRLWSNEKFEVTSPAHPGIIAEYAARTQSALRVAYHAVVNPKTIAVEFDANGNAYLAGSKIEKPLLEKPE